jgi:hypothetical protein
MAEHRITLTEGLLIAAVPAAGYWFAYLYELGFCKYFNLPSIFVDISIPAVLGAIVAVFAVLATIHMLAEPLFSIFSALTLPHRVKNAMLRTGIFILLAGGVAMVNRIPIKDMAWMGLFIGMFLFFDFIFPLITQRGVSGYLAKLEAQHQIDWQVDSLADITIKQIGRSWFLWGFLLLLLSFVAYFAGGFNARVQQRLIVLSGPPARVVLKHFGPSVVAATFDRMTRSVSPDYRLIAFDSDLGEFRFEQVGPLKPKTEAP